MNSTILREPYIDKNLSKYIFIPLGTYPPRFRFCQDRGIKIDLAMEYLICIEKHKDNHSEQDSPAINLGFKNDGGGYTICIRDRDGKLPKGIMLSIIKQSITTFIHNENEPLSIFYDFWDFLSFLTLYPEKKEENFLVLNRHTPKDHNLQEAKNIIWLFDSVENYIKLEDTEKTTFIQEEFKKICKQVIPRWQEFTEPNLNEFLIKKIASK